MSINEALNNEEPSLECLERKSRANIARELQRAEFEARTTARKCLGCGSEFRSEGSHNRMCARCKNRR